MNKELLPLGSIVLLNGGKKKLMVTGYLVSTNDYPNHVFDYCDVWYINYNNIVGVFRFL